MTAAGIAGGRAVTASSLALPGDAGRVRLSLALVSEASVQPLTLSRAAVSVRPHLKLRFHNTHHLLTRQTEREFSLESVKATVNYATHRTQIGFGAHGGKRWKLKKSVDGRTLVVVCEIKASECWLVTAYYETH